MVDETNGSHFLMWFCIPGNVVKNDLLQIMQTCCCFVSFVFGFEFIKKNKEAFFLIWIFFEFFFLR